MPVNKELANRFKYHPAKAERVKSLHTEVRNASALFASLIITLTPSCREQSLALTKVEEAMMWATAAIARDPRNADQEIDPEEQGLSDVSGQGN